MAEVILAELHFATNYISDYGAYGYGFNFSDERPAFSLELGDKCIVHWDGSEYEVTVGDSSSIMPDTLYVGNGSGFGLPGNGEPFAIAWDATGETGVTMFSTVDTVGTTHLVAIYTAESSEFAPNDIILKRYSGEEKVFKGVDVVRLTHASNEYTVPYTFGEAVENIPITLDLKDGDQTVTAPEGTLVKSAVISKPVNLTPENIRSGKTIAGVTGEFVGESEPLIVGTSEGAVALDWSAGDQIITPATDGKPFSPVTLEKPATLLPENIRKDVEIGGIVGEFFGLGTSKEITPNYRDYHEIDTSDAMTAAWNNRENIGKYFKYVGEAGEYIPGQYYKVIDENEAAARNSPAMATEVASGTTLTATLEGCKVGDLVIAAFVIRSNLVSLSNGWTLISTSKDQAEINSTSTVNQTLSFAYKYATSTTEAITVTQTSAARIYINMVSLSDATGFADAGYQYQNNATATDTKEATFIRPEGKMILWGITRSIWRNSDYPIWEISNNSRLVQLGSKTQSRLLLALDTSTDRSVVFTTVSENTTDAFICGALSVELEPSIHLIEVEFSDVPVVDSYTVNTENDELWNEVAITKPATLLPENIAEGIDIAGIIGTFAGGGGVKMATGVTSNAGQGYDLTITHGLGVVPDVVILFRPQLTNYHINFAFGGSAAFFSKLGITAIHAYGAYTSKGSPYIYPVQSADYTIDKPYALIKNANAQTFMCGTTSYRVNNGTTWIAIGGLT